MNLFNIDCLEKMKSMGDYSVDLIFTDPPYALGSEVIIREDGKPDYKKAVDFMNKWNQPDGKFWEEWFIEAFRILKHGGRVVMFGMDRQLMLNKYYACSSGFIEQQSLYWYFASSFPKASDLSKNLDKYFGEAREVVGSKIYKSSNGGEGYNEFATGIQPITQPSSDLAKKYDGFKYSIAPLKQTQEIVSVFQKIPDIYWDNRILLAQNIKDILECIMTTTHSNDLENGMIASNAEINFILLQVEQLQTQRGSHIAQMSVEEIEKIFACTAEVNSMLRQAKLGNIVVKNVMENLCADLREKTIHNGLADDLQELMDMYLSETPKPHLNGYWNIGQLWLNILVEIWIEMKMFTTSTKSEMITELKILNYYLTENIKYFTQQKILLNENLQKLIANTVIRNFTNVILKLESLNEIFVQNLAGIFTCETKSAQQNETIMVFQKPYKTNSALHDTLAYENGDEECLCGALDIDGNRISLEANADKRLGGNGVFGTKSSAKFYGYEGDYAVGTSPLGRFPSQTFVDSEMADNLDEQSGERKSGAMKSSHNVGKTGKDGFMPHHGIYGKYKAQPFGKEVEASVGGCSKILQRCDYDEQDIQLYHYCAKVSKSERDLGVKNNHVTVKPIQLCLNLLKLFKTPNPQVVFDPFLGSGSIGMAAKLLGFEFIGCELEPEYFEIAKLRIQYAIDNKFKLNRTFDTKHEPKNKKPTVNDNDFF